MRLSTILKPASAGYVEHESLSRGAAISFYVVTSLAPILLIVVAVAAIVFREDEVRSGLVEQMSGVFGAAGGEFIKAILARSNEDRSSGIAAALGTVMVLITASGVFGEIQAGLNRVWGVDAADQPWSSLIRTRAVSIGLVATLGFLMAVSLAASAAITRLGNYFGSAAIEPILSLISGAASIILFAGLFGIIYRTLPDTRIPWRDVLEGSLITSVLFAIGKALIGWYLGAASVGSGYGAAGAVILVLIWSYYSTQIFLFGAEITRAVSSIRLSERTLSKTACGQH